MAPSLNTPILTDAFASLLARAGIGKGRPVKPKPVPQQPKAGAYFYFYLVPGEGVLGQEGNLLVVSRDRYAHARSQVEREYEKRGRPVEFLPVATRQLVRQAQRVFRRMVNAA